MDLERLIMKEGNGILGCACYTEEETAFAALNASLTSATMRCSRSLLNEGFYEDDDFHDPS